MKNFTIYKVTKINKEWVYKKVGTLQTTSKNQAYKILGSGYVIADDTLENLTIPKKAKPLLNKNL